MAQPYKIFFSEELRAKLDEAAKLSGRPVSEEIRDRLEESFRDKERDALTRELAADVFALAREVALDFGQEWHADADAHAAMAAALADQFASYKPENISGAVRALLGRGNPDDPPDVVGRTHARNYRRKKEEKREDVRWWQNEGQKIREDAEKAGREDALRLVSQVKKLKRRIRKSPEGEEKP